MSRKIIDHDEEDRDSSEYEEIDEEDEDQIFSHQENQIIYDEQEEEPQIIDVVGTENAAEIFYDDVDMQDLVIHEIYGGGGGENENENMASTSQALQGFPGSSQQQQKQVSSKRISSNLVQSQTDPICIVCSRLESEKIRLFRWPKNEDLREQWIHFFRLPQNLLQITPEPYICSFHFTADTFLMVEDRIFWKASALPKYHLRRPCLSDAFPWENPDKNGKKSNLNLPPPKPTPEYRIRYRLPYNKNRSKNSHPVAILTPICPSQSHLFYEFHFNRNGLNGTKFYACLGCRKAKNETGIRDVIRTIHLQNAKIFTPGDPFSGHHFACRPHSVYDYNNSQTAAQNLAAQNRSHVVFLEEEEEVDDVAYGEPLVHVATQNMMTPILVAPPEPPIPPDNMNPERPIEEEYDIPPILEPEPEPEIAPKPKFVRKSKFSGGGAKKPLRLKCHLCITRRPFSTTRDFVAHLQKHLT